MQNSSQAIAPEWATVIQTLQDTNLQVAETNQLTRALRDEQRQAFKEMKELSERNREDHLHEYREMRETIREEIKGLQEFRKTMRENEKKFKAEMKERDEKFKAEMKERTEKFDAMMKKMAEEENRNREAYWKQSKETDKKIKELSTRFGTTTGNIIEGLMSSSAVDMFKKAGYDMHSKHKNMRRKTTNPNDGMEVDVFLYNDTSSIAVEVKASCERKDIDRFLEQMKKFRRLYPRYADLEVLGAIAAVNYENDADDYAHECGLIVVRTDSDTFFAIDPCEKRELKRF